MRKGLIAVLWLFVASCGGGGSGGGANIAVNNRVPDVVGQSQAAAATAITAAGLTLGTVTTASSATVAAGNVISQNPAAGALVPPVSSVNLVVSSGPAPTVAVPDVVGLSQGAATTAITAAGLTLGSVTRTSSANVPVNNVISQTPTGGVVVPINSTVNLVVSSGPNPPPFGINTRPSVANFTLPTAGTGSGVYDLVAAFPNLSFGSAIFMAGVPGDTRLVVVQQTGQIRAFTPAQGVSASRLILDLVDANGRPLLVSGGEQGLLGLAFDPGFVTNRWIYVHYTRWSDGAAIIARFMWDANTDSVNLNTQKIILAVPDRASNHNGGMIAFGPELEVLGPYLYIALGDEGDANDSFRNAQNMGSLFGKILRIDVHPVVATDAYDIPPDNPFVTTAGAQPEIWAYGLRNPFRFSFDRGTGQLWVGDVGQNATEEIDIITRGGNYGWPRFEGTSLYQPGTPLGGPSPHTPPIYEYDHVPGASASVIGGYVYRGPRIASLIGKYLYSDFYSGAISSLDYDGANPPTNSDVASTTNPSFGEDDDGEVYVVSYNDGLFQLKDSAGGGAPALLSQTGLFTNLATLTPAPGLIEYDLTMPFWSDGALKRRWVAVPSNAKVNFSPTGAWTFPVGTVIVKHFEMEMTDGDPNSARRLETRVLTRRTSGWMGFTYRWNLSETNANLLAARETEMLTINTGGGTRLQQYDYPSRTDCLQCHTSVAEFALGLATRQMNRDFDYALATDNQLRTLNHIGYFTSNIGVSTQYEVYPALTDTAATEETRARAYLAVNCAQCHQPGGSTGVNMDFRFDTANASMNVIDVRPARGDLGLPNARIIARGSKGSSVLLQRMRNLDGTRMPPLASHRVDQTAVDVIGSWIDAL